MCSIRTRSSFPFERATRFEDLETSEEVMAVPAVVREHYLEEIGGLIERYKRELGAAGIDYQLLTHRAAARDGAAGVPLDAGDGRCDAFLSVAAVPRGRGWRRRFRSCCTCSSASRRCACKFAAVKLLRRAPVEHTQTAPSARAAAAGAPRRGARPAGARVRAAVLRGGAAAGSAGVTVVALDTSLSMSAPGRFERAKQLARRRSAERRPATSSAS